MSGSTATAIVGAGSGGSQSGNVADTSTEGNVQVSITGEVSQIVIVYGNGPNANSNPTPQQIGISDLTFDLQPAIVCFTRSTLIRTPGGDVRIQDLRIGDLVVTADHGPQRIKWIGSRKVSAKGSLAPIRFAAGAIGNVEPLLLSPQHRVLLSGWRAQLFAGTEEVMIPALHLVNDTTILRQKGDWVEYFHIMFAKHEILFANNAKCESLFLSDRSIAGLGPQSRQELEQIFPDLLCNPAMFGKTARPCVPEYVSRLMI